MSSAWSRLIVLVGASGAGKDTLLRLWRERRAGDPRLHFVRRIITRPSDPAGEEHHPVSPEAFGALRERGVLAFDWQAHGLLYGVEKESLAALAEGRWAVLNGSRQHLPELRRQAAGCRVVEVVASTGLRRSRLAARSREDPAARRARLLRLVPPPHADLSLVNEGDPDACVATLDRWWQLLADDGAAAATP